MEMTLCSRCDHYLVCADYDKGATECSQFKEHVAIVKVPRCINCPRFYAYTNAKQGRGLCTHFMHEMPGDGFCSEYGGDDI